MILKGAIQPTESYSTNVQGLDQKEVASKLSTAAGVLFDFVSLSSLPKF
jgi:hypothetical protein